MASAVVASPLVYFHGRPVFESFRNGCGQGAVEITYVNATTAELDDYIQYGGQLMVLSYARPRNAVPNNDAVAFVKTFCPSDIGGVALLPGWKSVRRNRTFALVDVLITWESAILLYRGPAKFSAGAATDIATSTSIGGQTKATLTSEHIGKLCGLPAVFVAKTYEAYGTPLTATGVMTKRPEGTYYMEYLRQVGAPADPRALETFDLLCDATPTPEFTESPGTTPLPTATP
jgi:hypothetical protein